MVNKFHELELAISPFGVGHILKRTREFFDGAVLARHSIISCAHDTLKCT